MDQEKTHELRGESERNREEYVAEITKRLADLWDQHGFRCQREIEFSDTLDRTQSSARVIHSPTSLYNPEEVFQVRMYVSPDTAEREQLLSTLDWMLPHEVSHVITDAHKTDLRPPLSDEVHADLEQSNADLKPEVFYTGADEVATDVVAWRLQQSTEAQHRFAESLASFMHQDMTQEQSGKLEPFLRDRARFTVLVDFLKEQGIDVESDDRFTEVLAYWETDVSTLNADDQRRYGELLRYLLQITERTLHIPINQDERT